MAPAFPAGLDHLPTNLAVTAAAVSAADAASVVLNADQQRWDERYRAGHSPCLDAISPWIAAQQPYLTGGRALDAACGAGRHSLWLAGLGYQVDAVDVSAVALARLAEAAAGRDLGQRIRPLHADLTLWRPEQEMYDLILVSLYLERGLLPALKDALRPGGLILYTTFHTDLLQLRPQDNGGGYTATGGGYTATYLLQPGELLATFAGWQLLAYEERRLPPGSEERSDCTSSLLARKVEVGR